MPGERRSSKLLVGAVVALLTTIALAIVVLVVSRMPFRDFAGDFARYGTLVVLISVSLVGIFYITGFIKRGEPRPSHSIAIFFAYILALATMFASLAVARMNVAVANVGVMGRILGTGMAPEKTRAIEHFKRGEELYAAGSYRLAKAEYGLSMSLRPDWPDPVNGYFVSCAKIYLQQKKAGLPVDWQNVQELCDGLARYRELLKLSPTATSEARLQQSDKWVRYVNDILKERK